MIKTSCHPEFPVKNFKQVLKLFLLFVFSILFNQTGLSQRVGFTDNFDDGTMELIFRGNQGNRPPFKIWRTITPGTYSLAEKDSVLKIKYSRIEGIGAFDRFTFTPFRALNVSNNPRIQVQLKSNVETRLTVSPTYSLELPTF